MAELKDKLVSLEVLKEATASLQSDNASLKQLLPQATPTVGKTLKVLSVNADGTFVCGWADGASGGSTDVKVDGTSVTQSGVANIVSNDIVKHGLVSADRITGLTSAEMDNACSVIGAQRAKGEFVLKGTIVDNNGINVDLTGCTEFIIKGSVTATANCSIMTNKYRLSYNGLTSARKYIFFHFVDFEFGLECVDSKVSSGASSQNLTDTANHDVWIDGSNTSSINNIYFSSPDSITSCDIQIYAR